MSNPFPDWIGDCLEIKQDVTPKFGIVVSKEFPFMDDDALNGMFSDMLQAISPMGGVIPSFDYSFQLENHEFSERIPWLPKTSPGFEILTSTD